MMQRSLLRLHSGHIFSIFSVLLFSLLIVSAVQAQSKQHRLGEIPLSDEAYQKRLKKRDLAALDTIELALPASYDARDYGLVTPAKNQGSCGSCWAFAVTGALESHLIKELGTAPADLSEQQQVSCNTSMLGCNGGNSNALLYWTGKGPESEIAFKYTATDSTPCYEGELLSYRVVNYHTVQQTTAAFKESLYNDGPGYWRYNVYTDFDTYWNYGQPGEVYVSKSGTSLRGGHAVLLIGWDDSKGAFLCKNSWGTTGGPNDDGTFWIAYDGHYNNLGFGMANFNVYVEETCSSDAECDDGVFCNGAETCSSGVCRDGTPPCSDDGLSCNGTTVCNETKKACDQTEAPCPEGVVCVEGSPARCLDLCGNGTCDQGEDCHLCPGDCIGGSSGGSCSSCFKGICDGSCHPVKEDGTCSDCVPSYCCGDGLCNGAETYLNCNLDCPFIAYESDCSDWVDNDGDGFIDCDDTDCANDPVCQPSECSPRGAACTANGECCSGSCHPNKGTCR